MTDSQKPTAQPTDKTTDQGTDKGTPYASLPPEHQDALDVMAALCREYGLEELAPGLLHSSSLFPSPTSPASSSSTPQDSGTQVHQPIYGFDAEPQETAFSIIQKFLFDRDPNAPDSRPNQAGLDGHIPDPASVLAKSMQSSPQTRADQQKGPDMTQSSEASSTPSYDSAAAQWRLITTRPDGSETDLAGAVISDDMFRTAMPQLQGKDSQDADVPDWTIDLAQCLPLAAGRTSAQTAISAKLVALDTPSLLGGWCLSVGANAGTSAGVQSELAITVPKASPSHLRALLFDTTVTDQAQEPYSEMATYGGRAYALHLEQTIGDIPSGTTPNLALIRLIFADRPAVPAQLEYVGTLPSPTLRGTIPISPTHAIPFWMQITPPSEGDKGAGLVILVQYDQEVSFNVTAQLLTSSKSCTPTAILNCSGQSDNSACRAASMIANANGRLETTLTGLATAPTQDELAGYGFCLDGDGTSDTSKAAPVVTPTVASNAKPVPSAAKSPSSGDAQSPASPTQDTPDNGDSKSNDDGKDQPSGPKSGGGGAKNTQGGTGKSANSGTTSKGGS